MMYIDCFCAKEKNTPISYCRNKSMCLTGYAKTYPQPWLNFSISFPLCQSDKVKKSNFLATKCGRKD